MQNECRIHVYMVAIFCFVGNNCIVNTMSPILCIENTLDDDIYTYICHSDEPERSPHDMLLWIQDTLVELVWESPILYDREHPNWLNQSK